MRYFKAYMVTLKYITGNYMFFEVGNLSITSNKRNNISNCVKST